MVYTYDLFHKLQVNFAVPELCSTTAQLRFRPRHSSLFPFKLAPQMMPQGFVNASLSAAQPDLGRMKSCSPPLDVQRPYNSRSSVLAHRCALHTPRTEPAPALGQGCFLPDTMGLKEKKITYIYKILQKIRVYSYQQFSAEISLACCWHVGRSGKDTGHWEQA